MMNKQQIITQFAFDKPEYTFKKSEAVELLQPHYRYGNVNHHVGEMLSRMVKAGKLRRIIGKRGHYELITTAPLKKDTITVGENQIKLL